MGPNMAEISETTDKTEETGTVVPHKTEETGTMVPHKTEEIGTMVPHNMEEIGTMVLHNMEEIGTMVPKDRTNGVKTMAHNTEGIMCVKH